MKAISRCSFLPIFINHILFFYFGYFFTFSHIFDEKKIINLKIIKIRIVKKIFLIKFPRFNKTNRFEVNFRS